MRNKSWNNIGEEPKKKKENGFVIPRQFKHPRRVLKASAVRLRARNNLLRKSASEMVQGRVAYRPRRSRSHEDFPRYRSVRVKPYLRCSSKSFLRWQLLRCRVIFLITTYLIFSMQRIRYLGNSVDTNCALC